MPVAIEFPASLVKDLHSVQSDAVAISALAFGELALQTYLLWLIVKSSALGISPLLSPGAPPVAGAGVGGLAIE